MSLAATKFNPRTSKVVLEAVEKGLSLRAAAGYAGVSHTSVGRWIESRPAFSRAVERAKAKYLMKLVVPVTKAAEDDPRLAHAILKAKDPEGWAEQSRIEHTGEGGGPITIDLRWPDSPTPPSQMP